MKRRTRVTYVVITVAGLVSVTACAEPAAPYAPAPVQAVPVAVTSPNASRSGLGHRPDPAPASPPTVAKIQRWVKIYSGPSITDITPPKDPGRGSHVLELNAVRSDQIGTYLTDGAGRTLYRFDEDSARPPKSTCNADCAQVWRPMLIKSPGKVFPEGVNPKILGYVERADHTCQITVNGHPVYFFVADVRPGDINGQGVNGTWFAVAPNGGRTRPLPDALSGTRQPGR
jgi:predicted lipoprotein with Yx(FWY)xxD motif